MATRDRTADFERYKRDVRIAKPSKAGEYIRLMDPDVDTRVREGADNSEIVDAAEVPKPRWVQIADSVHADIAKIKQQLDALKLLHAERLGITFNEEKEKECDSKVDIVTRNICHILKRSETNVKRIALVDNPEDSILPQEEQLVRKNAMRSLGQELTLTSKTFRLIQKNFVKRLRESENIGLPEEVKGGVPLEELLLGGQRPEDLSPEQRQQLAHMKSQANDRGQAILALAAQINELASLFKELNVLVIEQGTILDRIDYNIERALENVTKGTRDIVEANNHSKKGMTLKCILVLTFLLIFFTLWLSIKYSN